METNLRIHFFWEKIANKLIGPIKNKLTKIWQQMFRYANVFILNATKNRIFIFVREIYLFYFKK